MKVAVVLTQWKRPHLDAQLFQMNKQTMKPDYIIVFQNENHVDIAPLKKKYNFIHVHSDYNTKYFGRFSYLFTLPVDYCLVFDDDRIPGINCVKNYVERCEKKNAIIGGNGRIAFNNKNKLSNMGVCGHQVRKDDVLMDFVGHLWCFKKEWLYYMFSVPPLTYDTGEDMHLCFSCKLLGNIDSYSGKQSTRDDCCDIMNSQLADDNFSSFKTTPKQLRVDVEQYWMDKGLKFIEKN